MRVLIVIPAYNEEESIVKTVSEVKKTGYDYLVVDDCSRDRTYDICKENNFCVIHLPINFGLASVMQIGFKYANRFGYDAVLQFDGDGQHRVEYIDEMVNVLEEGNDIVIGSRFVDEKKPWSSRMFGSRIISLFIKIITGKTINDPTSGMRLFKKSVYSEYSNHMNFPPEPDTLVYMLKKGKKIKEVQVQMNEREFGTSYLNPIRSIKYMIEMIVSIIFIQPFRKR